MKLTPLKISSLFTRSVPSTQHRRFITKFKAYPGITGVGETAEEADTNCFELLLAHIKGPFVPLWLSFRGETLLAWKNGAEWMYGHIRTGNEPSSCVIGGWSSRDEVEIEMRRHLAMATWNEQEEESLILVRPSDQEWFREWAQKQKRFLHVFASLQDAGWTHEEANHLLGGGRVQPDRIERLGDPAPLLALTSL